MNVLNKYYKNIIKYDLVNKFQYTKNTECPILKRIVLSFTCNNISTKSLIALLLALELITYKRGSLIFSKKPNIKLKIKKGYLVGCKIVVIKEKMFVLLHKLFLQTTPKVKVVQKGLDKKKNIFSFKIKNIYSFPEIETYYTFFKNLPELQISLCTSFMNYKECVFFFKSFKIYLQI